jgi:6-phosphogluconate dehydrogenase
MRLRPRASPPHAPRLPGLDKNLTGYHDLKDFVMSLQKPRCAQRTLARRVPAFTLSHPNACPRASAPRSAVIILVKAGSAVDDTIAGLSEFMEPGDTIIDGGNEWYENTERREKALAAKGLLYLGMGVSGGEEGARNGPSMMPGGSKEAYNRIADVVSKVSAQVDGGACVTYIGPGGAGNFVKMVHNGIEYGDMQLISEAYDMLKTVGGLTNDELAKAFSDWNAGELSSFLVEITAQIFGA